MARIASAVTFDAARLEVLTRMGQIDDGVANPALIAEAGAMLNVALRKLPTEHPYIVPRSIVSRTVAAGQTLLSLPSDAVGGEIREIRIVDTNSDRTRLNGDIDRGTVSLGLRDAWEMIEVIGLQEVVVTAGGSGFTGATVINVTGGTREARGDNPALRAVITSGVITDLLLDATGTGWSVAPTLTPTVGTGATLTPTLGPVPAIEIAPGTVSATVEIEYRRKYAAMTADATLLPFDAEAIISYAAALMAAAKGLGIAQVLGDTFKSYADGIRRRDQPARTFSMHSWRTNP